jgi:hypothetical protein
MRVRELWEHAPTGGGPLRASYERIAKRRGKQVAKVAVERKILTLSYYGLRDGEIRFTNNFGFDALRAGQRLPGTSS